MADINSSQTEKSSEIKTFNRWGAFWAGIGTRNLYNFVIGFLGWFLVLGSYWRIIFTWASSGGPGAPILSFFCIAPPLPISLGAVVGLMIKPRGRWIGVGILMALVINSIGIILFKGIDAYYLLASMPFFLPLSFLQDP